MKNKYNGDSLPEDEAISIIDSLIGNGFDIQFSYYGWIQGVEKIKLGPFDFEATRIIKN